ncbi:unnamed protein product, partial [Linum tenue]
RGRAAVFRFCSRAACSSERSGRLNRWIVLKFGQWVRDSLGFILTGGIVILRSSSSESLLDRRCTNLSFGISKPLFALLLFLLSTMLVRAIVVDC